MTLSLIRSWVGGYAEAALLLTVIPVAIGAAALTVSEPDRKESIG